MILHVAVGPWSISSRETLTPPCFSFFPVLISPFSLFLPSVDSRLDGSRKGGGHRFQIRKLTCEVSSSRNCQSEVPELYPRRSLPTGRPWLLLDMIVHGRLCRSSQGKLSLTHNGCPHQGRRHLQLPPLPGPLHLRPFGRKQLPLPGSPWTFFQLSPPLSHARGGSISWGDLTFGYEEEPLAGVSLGRPFRGPTSLGVRGRDVPQRTSSLLQASPLLCPLPLG